MGVKMQLGETGFFWENTWLIMTHTEYLDSKVILVCMSSVTTGPMPNYRVPLIVLLRVLMARECKSFILDGI